MLLDVMLIFTCWRVQVLSSSAYGGDIGGNSGGATKASPHSGGGAEQQEGHYRCMGG
jgi:hypothetical protein